MSSRIHRAREARAMQRLLPYIKRLGEGQEYVDWVGGKVLESNQPGANVEAIADEITREIQRRVQLLMTADRAVGEA